MSRPTLLLLFLAAGGLAAPDLQAAAAASTSASTSRPRAQTKGKAAPAKGNGKGSSTRGGKALARRARPSIAKASRKPARAGQASPARKRATPARGKVASRGATHRRGAKKHVSLERRVPAVRAGLPNVQAMGALVLDENGHELYARNPDHERPIASISKLAATLAVMDRGLELEGLSTITRADIDAARGGARSRLLEGMTLSNRDLLHAALMGSDNRAIPALGRSVKLTPSQLAAAMTSKAKDLGLKKTRFHDPTGLSIENVSTPRETIVLLQAVIKHPVLGPITQRVQYDAHPIGRPPISYVNTYRPAVRNNVQVLGGKTGYNDDARYCLVIAAKIDGRTCFMSFLANEGKLTRFGDVARVADWVVSRKPKTQSPLLADVTAGLAVPLPLRSPTAAAAVATTKSPTTTTIISAEPDLAAIPARSGSKVAASAPGATGVIAVAAPTTSERPGGDIRTEGRRPASSASGTQTGTGIGIGTASETASGTAPGSFPAGSSYNLRSPSAPPPAASAQGGTTSTTTTTTPP